MLNNRKEEDFDCSKMELYHWKILYNFLNIINNDIINKIKIHKRNNKKC
jgi:hypothetical protein